MDTKINYITITLVGILLFTNTAWAGTCGSSNDAAGQSHCSGSAPWTADSASYDDLNHCISTCAAYRDTIHIPAGAESWTSTLVITKGVALIGAGSGQTVVSYNGTESGYPSLISFSADEATAENDHPFVLKGFTLQSGSSVPYALLSLNNSHLDYPMTNIEVADNTFKLTPSGGTRISIYVYSAAYGVAYDNRIINGSHAWRYGGRGRVSWEHPEQWRPGSKFAFYFEDNLVSHESGATGDFMVSGGSGSKHVTRYNTVDFTGSGVSGYSQAFDQHGNQPNNSCGAVGTEIYGNLRIGANGRWHDNRGGITRFFYNQWDSVNSSVSLNIREEYDDSIGPSGSIVCPAGKNCIQHTNDSYYWNNRLGTGGLVSTYVASDEYDRNTHTDNDPPLLVENATHWTQREAAFDGTIAELGSCGTAFSSACTKSGVGCGRLADRPSTCSTGVAYWATDQSCSDLTGMVGASPAAPISGTLYKCVSTNSWEAYYTPYTYPHPLRNPGSGDNNTPSPPANLSIQE